jgi:hypothetical protein
MKTAILSLALVVMGAQAQTRRTKMVFDAVGGIDWLYTDYHDGAEDPEFRCGWVWFDQNDKTWHASTWLDKDHGVLHYHHRKDAAKYVSQWCKP